ncbi:PLC-like phosphodiesterase [Xylariaceae sp. FL0804]|nr:PLC-like phosphodiesterase [Xylariaceae sp. FL0804]
MRPVTLPALALAAGACATDCNGYSALCDVAYSAVSFVGSHDAAFVGELPTENQLTSVADQLDLGIRFLEVQTHDKDGTIELCHTSCLELDAGSLADFLATVNTWVEANPDEVLTLLITNGDDIAIADFGDAFTSAGLDQYVFTPDGDLALADWPTLGDLISAGTRVVVFMDYNADTSVVPYILDEFTYYFETPFDPVSDQLSDCSVDRSSGAATDTLMILANHNLNYELLGILIPDLLEASSTNSLSSIMAQADTCQSDYGRVPNVVLLDYVSVGDALEAQNELNGVS